MYQLKIAPLALEDMLETKRYITEELYDPTAATQVIKDIVKRIDSLKNFPCLGEQLSDKVGIQCGYRYLICHNYLIFYRIEGKNIFIVRVLFAKSNYSKVLLGEI